MGHFARNCPKPRENANLARENERNSNFGNWLDLGDNSVCEECAMICTDVYSTDESEGMIVYGDQGISSENYDEDTYGDLLNTESDDEQVIKYDVALLATDSVSLEKKRRRLNRDIPSEAPNYLSRLNDDSDTKQGLTTQAEESESQEARTMGMLSIDGDISTTNSSEQQRIEDKNKQFLYARAMHASHMIQHHMQGISERERVINEYRAMMDAGREMIPLDSDLHQSDPVIIQHIMQMIDTDIFWYGETFRQVITELRKKALHETTMLTGEKLDENAYRESAMMCWESLDESEPTSKKRKTLCQEEATNDPSDKIDDDPHTQRTANKGVGSIIPVNDLQLGTDDDASTLATQETLAKNLVYVTNIPDGKLAHTDIARDSSKNSSEKDGKPSSLLEKPDQLIRKDTLYAYGTSKTNDKREKGKERTTNTWRTRKIIHTEFESDDDVAEPQKNAETTKKEGKVRVTTKTIHYYEFSSDEEDEAHADPKTNEKTHADHEKSTKKGENDQALVSNEMTPSTIGSDIFIGDSAATSHMTNNKTGVYDLKPIRGSVMIGNGESISCTHKGKLDVICKHKDGSTAKHTWEVKIVPQLNHDLFSFTKAMKEGWQMHGRWKEGGLMIELSQTSKNSIKFDRMIPSGSSWLMGLKTQRLVGQAHAVIEPGKSIPILKFHHITGHTGEHLLRPTAEYMGIKLTGKLEPNEQEIAETNDGNNTEEQKRLGIDIQMIGAREEELGRTRSQTREMMSPRNESMERAELTMEDWIQETCFISAVTSGPTEPKTFQEAWHSPIEEERHKWQAAIRKEIRSMINRGVWRKIDKMKIPENRRLIGNKWVFKIKRDGTYRARLVALGYSQIPGVDFTDNFAPVAHDVSFRIALARMMVEKLDSLVMDVETAFLYGDIEEEIFMKSPVGMEEIDPGSSPEDCFQLKKGIYGLCQAARQFWKKFVETIKKEPFGFTVSQADPCMLFKENNLGICIIIMYVDDMLVIGKKEQIQEFATMIQKEFSVKIQHNLADYLGCEFHMNKERTKGWLGQPSIIKSLEQKFGEKAMKTRSSLTPGTPRFIARRLENEEDKVNAQDHETYRSGVGTLLYLTKHSRPDISNPVRELSKTMDAPAPAHLKEMYKLIRFVLETQDHGLKFKLMKSIRKWVLEALSDSDFASDKETRISVFGYVIYFCGIPIAWRSKGMKSVVLSTTEAEYMALSEVVKELKFIVQLLQTMNITVELPITVYVDNVGAIWLSNNRNTGDRTKHIDIRTAFVKEYQEDGKIIIKFVKSEENDADIFMKNTSSIIYQKHQEKLVWDKKEVNDDQ